MKHVKLLTRFCTAAIANTKANVQANVFVYDYLELKMYAEVLSLGAVERGTVSPNTCTYKV